MTRASPLAKRQPGAANQRDNHNESGVGSHGKRTTKYQQKPSHGLPLVGGDAVARSSPSSGNSVLTIPSHPPAVAAGAPSPPTLFATVAAAAVANGCTRGTDTMASSSPAAYHGQQRHRKSDPSLVTSTGSRRSHVSDRHLPNVDVSQPHSSSDSLAVPHTLATSNDVSGVPAPSAVSFEESYRRIDVNATKNANVHRDTGPLDLAITILRSCPLYDTIAILIILMQLSPVVLSVVYMLFTVLTFVPPVTSSSGLSLTEIFEGGLGTPSGAADADGHTGMSGNITITDSVNHSMGPSSTVGPNSVTPSANTGFITMDADSASAPGMTGNTTMASIPTTHISSKKKKKQSALVRLRQPLWAALASTKIVMIKEYELSQAASESAGAEATDVDNLGNAPFYAQPGQIWVCYVGHDEVCFSTSAFPSEDKDQEMSGALAQSNSFFIDTTKPFYVRINNATWQPTRIIPIVEGQGENPTDPADDTKWDLSNDTTTRWTGDIYGLTPLSSYECEFVSTRSGEVLFSTSVRTAAAPSKSTAIAAAKPAPPSQLRPHESPATTIKASITTQEAKLNDEKTRFKTLRRDNNRRANALKKEIDRLTASVQSAGGNDDKFKQKITQNSVQQKQAEQAIEVIEAELKDISTVPEEILGQYRNKKSEWDREKAQFDGVMASFKSFKSSVDSEIQSLEDDHATFQAKRNKIASRIAKADSEHAQIMDANARGLDEAERRRQERVNIETEIARSHQSYVERLVAAQNANEEKTPWSAIPTVATSGVSPITVSAAPVAPFIRNQQLAATPMPPILRMRGRSSSMLSDVSGFTQSSTADDDNTAAHIGGVTTGGSHSTDVFVSSSSSGSASGSGSGSSVHSGSGSAGSIRDLPSPL
ncbi:hypothetical protein HMPREF1624_01808 [Sporothrix schenckii ATCC 58251]|uniref:Ubiquitination network signaling protein n=1 Tax=Sporothrix schenckii (strain ATCC 58251 / de Perez 2211183) TaxID=1391915 RepID=U7Q083_SPOS1|nr:hypothetical protein HMPREF1624_01808 [Sporothrix schenckii ATCC 58251]